MSLRLEALPAFQDNYIWLLRAGDDALVVDPGDSGPVWQALERDSLRLRAVLVTHHHADHMGGAMELASKTGSPVYGPAGEPIAAVDHPLRENDAIKVQGLGLSFAVLDIPGHTAGHIAYHGHGMVFCGDTLFSAGCGRLFEGTAAQMFQSLGKLAALPGETTVCCGHEYTLANLRFAQAVEPGNPDIPAYARRCETLRAAGKPTLPSSIGLERKVNPFLRTAEPAVAAAASRHAGRPLREAVDVFAEIRSWKDGFA